MLASAGTYQIRAVTADRPVVRAVLIATALAFLVLFLLRGRAPAVYAGVFFAVAYLEIYGTAVGTWRWATEIPGVGVADGNPPSGAACGYVFFDIAALYLAPALLTGWSRLRRLAPVDGPVVVQEAGAAGVAQPVGQQVADRR